MPNRAKERPAGPEVLDAALDAQSLVEAMREVVAELHPHLRARTEITLDSSLERDLGLDSISRMELLARLERTFGAVIPEAVMANAETARELLPALRAGERHHRAEVSTRRTAEGLEAGRDAPDAVPTDARTLLEAADYHARHHGERVHVELCGSDREAERITYAGLVDRAEHIAAGLANRGLEPGQSAALMLPTGFDYLATFLAVQMAGAVPVPIYPPARMSQLEDHVRRHAGILSNARARMLVTFAPALGVSRLLTAQVPGFVRWSTSPLSIARAGSANVRGSTSRRPRSCSTPPAAPAVPRGWCSVTATCLPRSRPWPPPSERHRATCS